MAPIRLAIVGCGGMGHRHLAGLAALHRAGWEAFELVGACDPVRANAESLAAQAAQALGAQPGVVAHVAELEALGVEAVDITTTPRWHHAAALEALERGWHVMVEKPVGLTVRASNLIREAAGRAGRVVSVAENYRRDPVNRLARAVLDAGIIGAPRLAVHHSLGGGSEMLISQWRHQKDQSGLLIDVGVHYADMLEYLLGPIDLVYAHTRLHEPVRSNPAASGGAARFNPSGVYGRWQREMPASFEATAEDAVYATMVFGSGAVCQYVEDHAARGPSVWARQIFGAAGVLDLPEDRTGGEIRAHVEGRGELGPDELLALLPDFRLDPVTTALFGGQRLARFQFPFAETDSKLLAVEYADFADAIRNARPPEVDAAQGARSVAVAYAWLESSVAGRAVTVDEVLSGQFDAYQREIDAGMGLT
jgi:predicted dehydrogenase